MTDAKKYPPRILYSFKNINNETEVEPQEYLSLIEHEALLLEELRKHLEVEAVRMQVEIDKAVREARAAAFEEASISFGYCGELALSLTYRDKAASIREGK